MDNKELDKAIEDLEKKPGEQGDNAIKTASSIISTIALFFAVFFAGMMFALMISAHGIAKAQRVTGYDLQSFGTLYKATNKQNYYINYNGKIYRFVNAGEVTEREEDCGCD